MKKIFILPVLAVALIGVLSGKIVYDHYQETANAMSQTDDDVVYFLQQGVYTNFDIMLKNRKDYPGSIYVQEDDKYYLYVGISKQKENAVKIQKIYEAKNIPIYIREVIVTNTEFLSGLEQYDILLKGVETEKEVMGIVEVILGSYSEIVLNQ